MNFFIDNYKQVEAQVSNRWRSLFIWLVVVLAFSFLLFNLFDLQIIHGEDNLIKARNISYKQEIIRASRGIIYDTNRQILAKNVPSFSLYIKPAELQDQSATFSSLASILSVDKDELLSTYEAQVNEDSQSQTSKTNVTITNELTNEQYLSVLANINSLPGVYTVEDVRRSYQYNETFSHILGYVSDINEKEVQETGLDPNAKIGKEGLEKVYDDVLRGKDGENLQTVDIFKQRSKEYVSQTPEDGHNLILTIDANWQQKLWELTEAQVGATQAFGAAVVIMESDTGAIKAMINYPSYDNNLFAKGINAQDFEALYSDLSTPLVNRSIALQLPTGSIFKPMVAAAALEEGVLTSSTKYQSGCVDLPLYRLCEADLANLGTMSVVEGLGKSSNVFFCRTGLDMVEKADGIRTLISYTNQFGIGTLTGIDLPGEQMGTMASPELKQALQKEPWYLADICNTVIGQGLVTATPIQMVSVAATIANNGKVYKPQLVDEIINQDNETVQKIEPELMREVQVSDSNFELIKKGMLYAVNGSRGSATELRGLPGDVYAKTGSADASEYRNGVKVEGAHSWSIGGFEYEGKNYSFVIHLQEGGRGYKNLPIIKGFIEWLYQ